MILFQHKKKEEIPKNVLTAQQFVNVKTIKNNLLYSKDGNVFAFLSITPIIPELLSEQEKIAYSNNLISRLSSETEPFQILKYQKSVDVSKIINQLMIKRQEASEEKRKHLLTLEIKYLDKVATTNNAIAIQYYCKIWGRENNIASIQQRISDLAQKFTDSGYPAEICTDRDIFVLCSYFTAPAYVGENIDDDLDESPISSVPRVVVQGGGTI